MGVAFYIELDKDVEFDTFVDGKSIAHAFDELTSFSKNNGLKSIEDYVYQDVSEFANEFEEIGMDVPEQIEQWFDADDGVSWAADMIKTLKAKSPEFATEYVIDDFKYYLEIFKNAKKVGAKWHLAVDI
jgi:hypothetical protein